mmetsp:Transcript_10877/g.19203  ORF Transcript_10877/g.19203 Transcript_10877/m.19203 type:complete len:510 (+) Transcript_10877:94-1623(+)
MRWSGWVAAACAACVAVVAEAGEVPPSRVETTHLPGWEGPLPSRWFSGYLDGGKREDNGKQLWYHYTLILAEGDEEEVPNKPLMLWTNGGPGASSLFGILTELGQFTMSSESLVTDYFNRTGIPSLFRNEFAWTKLGSVLILNGPPPVSFSYCDSPGPGGGGYDCGAWDDALTAKHNYNMVESFFKVWPEFQNNDFYLTGESYAGIYIPTLAREILKHNASESIARRQLRGMAVGDGCVGSDIICGELTPGGSPIRRGVLFSAKFMYGHHQIPTRLWEKIEKACDLENGDDDTCKDLNVEMMHTVGGFFEYNLYDECKPEESLPVFRQLREELVLELSKEEHSLSSGLLGGALNDYPCGGGLALGKWVLSPEVREALAILPGSQYVSGDNSAGLNYTGTEKNLLPFHKSVALDTDVRVLIYNGDTDPGLNSFVAEDWVNQMGLEIKEDWRAWTKDGKTSMGGYVTTYEGDFVFATIRGSGHMVPGMKPEAAYVLIKSFLENKPLPGYQK